MPLQHDELMRRISRDIADGYDEELEMDFPYRETERPPTVLSKREHHEHYSRQAVPADMMAPEVY